LELKSIATGASTRARLFGGRTWCGLVDEFYFSEGIGRARTMFAGRSSRSFFAN
jgi:hypothetical protein